MRKRNIIYHIKQNREPYGEELTHVEKLIIQWLEEPWYKSIWY